MEEKKMTDEEILKSLECCTKSGRCTQCPYFIKGIDCVNEQSHEKDILDFIHRLQDENAKQKVEIEKLHTLTDMQEANVNTMFENNMGLRKEIERLTTRCEIAEGTKNRLTIFDRIEIHDKAVKDTAKEILCELLDINVKDEDYKMFFLDVCEKLEKFSQKYGVEVE